MKRVNALVWGIVLLLGGGVLLLWQFRPDLLGDHMVWPIFLLGLGVVFHLYYFIGRDHNEGLLVPGGILLVYGAMFFLAGDNGEIMGKLWPMFILGPAFGLFELYAFSLGRRGSMIPVFILTAIGGGFLLMNFGAIRDFRILIAVLALCLGAGMMISAFTKGARRSPPKPPVVEVKPEQKAEPKAEPVWETKPEPSEEIMPEPPADEQPKQ